MRASGPVTPSLPSAPFRRVHREAASRAYVTVRTLIVKIISPLQNDVRRLRCACVLGIKRARRVVPDIRLQKSVCALQFFKRSTPDLPSFAPMVITDERGRSIDDSSNAPVKTAVTVPFLRCEGALEQVFFH
jgi:hypothetical protein